MSRSFITYQYRFTKSIGWCLTLLVVVLCSHGKATAKQLSRADQLRAAFLYNFIQFTDWHPSAFSSPSADFVIGIIGTDPFGAYLDSLVKGERTGQHKIVVERYSSIAEVKKAHLLYINRSDIDDVIKALAGKSILTVGSHDNFIAAGGIIRLYMQNNKMRFQVSLSAARAAKLNISSKLLRVADVVN